MKKFYQSPVIEVTAFVAEDILCASTVSFDNGSTNYDLVSNGIVVESGVQRVEGTDSAPYNFGQ